MAIVAMEARLIVTVDDAILRTIASLRTKKVNNISLWFLARIMADQNSLFMVMEENGNMIARKLMMEGWF